jgi:YggT family protein
MISVFATVVYIGLYLFFLALWVRFIFDWVQVLSRNFRPRGPLLFVAETAYTITDKPLVSIRRVIPPLRFGGAAIDLGWSVLMIATLVLLSVVGGFR